MSLLRGKAGAITFGLVGYLFLVELVSGILQGFYVPLIPDLVEHLGIRDADFNWFEAAQLLLSAIVVPILAKLGDMYGHKRILLISTVLTAAATWARSLRTIFRLALFSRSRRGVALSTGMREAGGGNAAVAEGIIGGILQQALSAGGEATSARAGAARAPAHTRW